MSAQPTAAATRLLERAARAARGPRAARARRARDDVELVGGAVRDLLLGAHAARARCVVDGAAQAFAESSPLLVMAACAADGVRGERRSARALRHGGRALGRRAHRRCDAARRVLRAPGRAAGRARRARAEQDLLRRDFTVNAIAVALGGARRGELRAAPDALDDLAARRLRVLHDASFRDDPTRLLRLARYAARLGFAPDERTARWPLRRSPPSALATVSPRAHRRRAAPDARRARCSRRAARRSTHLGALAALHQSLTLDAPLARAALARCRRRRDAWPDVLLLATLLLPQGAYDATITRRACACCSTAGVPGRRPRARRAQRAARASPWSSDCARASVLAGLRGRRTTRRSRRSRSPRRSPTRAARERRPTPRGMAASFAT